MKHAIYFIGVFWMILVGCVSVSDGNDMADSERVFRPEKSFQLADGVQLEMVFVKGGVFLMGGRDDQLGRKDIVALPAHQMEVDDFWIGKYEVTDEQYVSVMSGNEVPTKRFRRPVTLVRWNEALEFCRRLSERTGWTFNLPTEAQWEYACRAGSQSQFCFGDDERNLGKYAWYERNESKWSDLGHPHDVGQKKPNAWGIYDMHGNVHEWCRDRWVDGRDWIIGQKLEQQPIYKEQPGQLRTNPHVYKGGDWGNTAGACRCAARHYAFEQDAEVNIGFRVVAIPPVAKEDVE